MKYYCSACSSGHGNWLTPLGFEESKQLEDADVVIFGGGADVAPATYGEETGSRTYASPSRDKQEKADFEKAFKLGKKLVGICRGQQMLCALAGGKLIQHVNGHSGRDHSILTYDERKIITNSIHHQIINPYNLKSTDYKILAWTSAKLSDTYLGAKDKSIQLPYDFKEIEAAYFPKIRALTFQYHPEMMYKSSAHEQIMNWTQGTFNKFFNDKL